MRTLRLLVKVIAEEVNILKVCAVKNLEFSKLFLRHLMRLDFRMESSLMKLLENTKSS